MDTPPADPSELLPPPSTLAADFANNLSTARRPSRADPQDAFEKLVADVSAFMKIPDDTIPNEQRMQGYHELIFVLVSTVLEVLEKRTSLFHEQDQLQQAEQGLDVLIGTFRAAPGLLEQVPGERVRALSGSKAPLWWWLFPRLLVLVGNKRCAVLQDRIRALFKTVFNEAGRCLQLWGATVDFFGYVKYCANAVLDHLQLTNVAHGNSFELVLPLEGVKDEVAGSCDSELDLEKCSYAIHDVEHALNHSYFLLRLLADMSTSSAISYEAVTAFQGHLAWVLDSFVRLRDLEKTWGQHHSAPQTGLDACVLSVRCVHSLLMSWNGGLSVTLERKGYCVLAYLCTELWEYPGALSDPAVETIFCVCILDLSAASFKFESVSQAVRFQLVPVLEKYQDSELDSGMLSSDVLKCVTILREDSYGHSQEGHPTFPSITSFDKPCLTSQMRHLSLRRESAPRLDDDRPAKRRKTSPEQDVLSELIREVFSLLGSQPASDLDGLSQVAADCFAQLNDRDRCRAMKYLSLLSCASAGTLTILYDRDGKMSETKCSICDSKNPVVPENTLYNESLATEAISTFTKLLSLPEFEESRRPRVLGMLGLRYFAKHFRDVTFLNLETSPLGQWCLKSLRSSMRELRIAAGRTLPIFLRKGIESDVLQRNKMNVLDFLRHLSEQCPLHMAESCILAWGQVGRISDDKELNLVLLRLAEYLGHTNQIASGTAFNEILGISEKLGIPVGQMFRPFWRSIGPTFLKDLQNRPQTAQLMADLLKFSVAELLVSIQADVLPWLVLTKKKDMILRIAQAAGEVDPGTVCLESSNLGPIMALLLVQNVNDLESFIMALFRDVSPLFVGFEFVDLLKMAPMLIAVELLKNAGEEDDSRKSRVRHALQFLASRTTSGSESTHSKRGNQVEPFLEQHILPIMFHFSDLLNDTQGWQCPAEKRRSLKGIEEMLRVGKGYIGSALPQICACLQSAMIHDDIRPTAFSAWKTMIQSLDDEDVGPMLETTFSMIILKWNVFDATSRRHGIELVGYLLKDREDLMRNFIDLIPSLDQIEELASYEVLLKRTRAEVSVRQRYRTFSHRIMHEHESVVTQALIELGKFLQQHQGFLQASAVSEQPDSVVGELLRSILDAAIKFGGSNLEIARLSAECIGLIGCLDSNRVEATRELKEIVIVSNFDDPAETTDFVFYILKEVFVKAFLSATDPRAQGFLSYAMQELLEKSDIKEACSSHRRGSNHSTAEIYKKWLALPETVRQILSPFLKSRYKLGEMAKATTVYPIFDPKKKYTIWLRAFVLDLLRQPRNANAMIIFGPLCRVIRIEDTSVASFLLPFVVLHAVVLGTEEQRRDILSELLKVLSHEAPIDSHSERTTTKLCSEAVFRILDYISRWSQERQKTMSQKRGYDSRWSNPEENPSLTDPGIERVAELLAAIPAEVISRRAVECESYSRALFHWEQHIRQQRDIDSQTPDKSQLLERLQKIYTQIDEPDGIEGIAAHLHVLDIDQQILGHRKAGRWSAAQSWYEIKLAEEPSDTDVQVNLLYCLKESGQHDVLLNYVEGMHKTSSAVSRLLPFAAEASWATGRWDTLQKYVLRAPQDFGGDFNIGVGQSLLALHNHDQPEFGSIIRTLREQIACSLSPSTTSSLGVCHDTMLKFHVLTELEMITNAGDVRRKQLFDSLDRRLEAIGAYLNDKQYVLGIRRAAMQLTRPTFSKADIASVWLTSARLARKGNSLHQSFNAVLHASQLGDESATIEHTRLLWKEGQHRKAIQSLQGAITANAFISHNRGPSEDGTSYVEGGQQNLLAARAHLLLAKWLDSAGHTHSMALRSQYQLAAKMHQTWEKGHYYLGRHYNKLLESEKALPPEQQAQSYLIGDTARLVIENYLRSLSYGTKYIYQTLPRILTLWLDLGTQVNQPMDARYGTKEFIAKITTCRREQLTMLHNRFTKYIQKMPAYILYTALPQIVARITHPNGEVYQFLHTIIVKVVAAHPQQALWTLLAVSTSTQPDRKTRGMTILAALRNMTKKNDTGAYDLRMLVKSGERLASQLLMACNSGDFHGNRTIPASLSRDLGFNQKTCIPSPLCVPMESALTATLPTLTDSIRSHKAFSRDVVTISSFLDEVLVLSSLQKPRKLTARGSDGKNYGLLCKPNDDLRKDQRLMEFNSMINRSLKRDAESSKRQLYIKTYAVTPLNEACGIIEWVNGLKTLRDILLNLYKVKGITANYGEIKILLDEACKGEDKLPIFKEKVIAQFPPVFHSWFVQQFPDPSAWFVARLKYTRSCAVMSMVGTILGLGDRHGENILFEEGNGGTFHVDFNCLFDKGLTFAQPERVPFRLTHNMVDAMGVYGYEGPFRKSAELTLKLLRQHEETLMTIMEAFVYDPTLDLLAKKSEKKARARELEAGGSRVVTDTPQGVLDNIRRKVRGLLVGESVPLGVEGQVDELIKQAVDSKNLAAMYIGWCAFF